MTFDWTMDFLELTPKAWETKVKIDKKNYIKLKNFCASKGTINRLKSQPIGQNICKPYS